jgi:hypothetical protein
MLKLIIQAEEINDPDGRRDFRLEVYMDPNIREAHVTDLELMAMTSLKDLVLNAIKDVGTNAVAKGDAGLFVEREGSGTRSKPKPD